MACFNFRYGTPVAKIHGGDFHRQIIYLYDPDVHGKPDKPMRTTFDRFSLPEDAKLIPLPNPKPERSYIAGPSGAGKSTWVAMYLKQIRKHFPPEMPIYLFSDVEEDEVLDKIPGVERVSLEELMENPPQVKDFKDSVVVFDDIDSIQDKVLLKFVRLLQGAIMKTSRHYNTWVLCTNHLTTDYSNTRSIINDAKLITAFPKCGASNQVERLLKTYGGLSTKELETVKKLPSRWVTLNNFHPRYIMHDKGVYLLQ